MKPLKWFIPAFLVLVLISPATAQTAPTSTVKNVAPATTLSATAPQQQTKDQNLRFEQTHKLSGTSLQTENKAGLPPQEFYQGLNNRLSPFFSVQRPKPSQNDKIWGAIGKSIGIGCAGIAAYQAIPLLQGKKQASSR
jgi:hypothetical protein